MVNLLLLCNLKFCSSMLPSCLSFRYQTGMRIFYVTPSLIFWFIVVSSVFPLFSSLDRFSLIPTTSKFDQQLQAWIHSTQVTPGSRPLSPWFGGTSCHRVHPKYPLKFCHNDHWMTCHPPWLPQPPPSFFSCLGLVGRMVFTLGLLGCCFEREKIGTTFSQILRPIILLSLYHPFKARDPL